jgi:uncharacterized protein (DUF58 family)
MAVIPLEFLKKVRRIEFQTNRLVEDLFAGKYRSVFRGRGIDFEEVREYAAGDDVRYIDWNVSARMRSLFVKVFREERELTVILAVDISSSADLGSGHYSKREFMAEVASVLALSAVRNNDRVGLLLFTDKVQKYVRPNKGRRHVLRVIRDILYYRPDSRGTDCKEALRYIGHVAHRNAMIFLISDFLDEGFERAMRITNHDYDLVPVLVVDERELELPSVGVVALEDAETGEIVEVRTSNRRVRRAFAAAAQGRLAAFRRGCLQSGMDIVEVRSGRPYIEAFQKFFANRLKRR